MSMSSLQRSSGLHSDLYSATSRLHYNPIQKSLARSSNHFSQRKLFAAANDYQQTNTSFFDRKVLIDAVKYKK